ncbi:hypothetical protein BUALT_Bualt01G0034500 [Buddleja alternifolia]|uniref:UBC core domain-containing protein n=1 Tax=Buddleja alternifolia TaxID=168488 RepID=A0AAV6YA55_9LAMI|nr:hypothetical protein BUALT_Bualt01G0034500 [Buddleja alternifolia]
MLTTNQSFLVLSNPSLEGGAMIKLFKVKEKQRELAENANGMPPVKKQSAGELRLHKGFSQSSAVMNCLYRDEVEIWKLLSHNVVWKGIYLLLKLHELRLTMIVLVENIALVTIVNDISELNMPKTCSISFPNGKDELMNFEVTIRPDEGYYLGGTFVFTFQISPIYPHEAPKVKCKTKVYHPNIDLEGNVCLNILREDWKPVLNINTIIYGLYHLFTEPNHEDPLNPDAAAVLRDNPKMFESNVRRAMAGGYVGQTFFARCV